MYLSAQFANNDMMSTLLLFRATICLHTSPQSKLPQGCIVFCHLRETFCGVKLRKVLGFVYFKVWH